MFDHLKSLACLIWWSTIETFHAFQMNTLDDDRIITLILNRILKSFCLSNALIGVQLHNNTYLRPISCTFKKILFF